MKTSICKTLILAGAAAIAPLLIGQEVAQDASQETVSISNPLSKPQAAQAQAAGHVEQPAPHERKFEWKSEEAKKRLAAQAVSPEQAKEERAANAAKLQPRQAEGPSSWRLLVAFAVMGGLLYGLYLFLKKFGKKISGQETGDLKVVSKIKIDSRNSLVLVQFHEEELLLSVNSAGGMQALSKCTQLDLAEAETNAGEVAEDDAANDEIYDSFTGMKASSMKIEKEERK